MASSACCVASSARSRSRRIRCATAWSRSPDGHGEAREGLFVAALRSSHEIGIHASSASEPVTRTGPLTRYGRRRAKADSIFDRLRCHAMMDRWRPGPPSTRFAPSASSPTVQSSGSTSTGSSMLAVAPASSKNQQHWAFIVLRDRAHLTELADGRSITPATLPRDGRGRARHAGSLEHHSEPVGHGTGGAEHGPRRLGARDRQRARDRLRPRPADRLLGLPDDRRCDFLLSFGLPRRRLEADGAEPSRRARGARRVVHEERW